MKPPRLTTRSLRPLAVLAAVLPLVAGCAVLEGVGAFERPDVELDGARLTGVGFDGLDAVFDLEIDNPNPYGLSLARLDYELSIAGARFLSGEQREGFTVPSRGARTTRIPVHLDYRELYAAYRGLRDAGETDYRIDTTLYFEVPVVGTVRIPVSHDGELPLARLPSISVTGVSLEGLTLNEARLSLGLEVDNPNTFPLDLDGLDYVFEVSGERWAEARLDERARVRSRGQERFEIPVTVDLVRAGQGAYRLLARGGELDYRMRGEIDAGSSLPGLGDFDVPFDRSGRLRLGR